MLFGIRLQVLPDQVGEVAQLQLAMVSLSALSKLGLVLSRRKLMLLLMDKNLPVLVFLNYLQL